ncbi:coiled-coil domain-containing protein [Pontibacter burrus]|uniref:Phage tail tape measure protein n=1 Tax=Pontibacter burrus TaxID=2704466 RepID=A0A6B3LRR1_9BACT|nr:hypothetical protein [Pontibacter burrus]NEM96160.1 hypothetical protein [Pontibacter burrus]
MSEKNEVLLRIRIDEAEAQKKIVSYQKEINAARDAQAALAKAIKEAGSATDEQVAQQVALKARLKELTTQQNLQIKAIDTQRKADQAAVGSINQLRAQLASLTTQWNELSEEERNNAEIGGKLQKATKDVSDKLKELEASVGDTRRNVGNYSQSMLEAVDGSGKLQQAIDLSKKGYDELKGLITDGIAALKEEVKAKLAAEAATNAKTAAEAGTTAATTASTAATNISKAAIIGKVSALKLLKLALAATGIGAVLLLLGGLISFLTRTQKGIDTVSRYTAAFSKVMGFLLDKLSAVGEATIAWFKDVNNLGDFLKKLGNEILQNVINRLKGFLVIWEAVKSGDFTKLQDGITQVATGITDASAKAKAFAKELADVARAAADVERETQRIERAERALNVEREQANAFIERNKMLAEDATKSEAERMEAARKAFAKEEELRGKQLQLQRDKIANLIAEQKLTNNLNADHDKLAEAQAELAKIEAESLGKSTELQNKLNDLRKQAQQKQLEATRKQLEAEAALLEVRTQSSLNSEEDLLELRLQLLAKKQQQELLAEDLTQAQIKVIKEKYLAEEAQLRDEFRENQRKKELEEETRTAQARLTKAQQVLAIGFGKQQLALKQQRAQGLLSAAEYERQQEQLTLTRMQSEILLMEKHAGAVEGMDKVLVEKRAALAEYLADKQIKAVEKAEEADANAHAKRIERQLQELEMADSFLNAMGDMFANSLTEQGFAIEQFSQGVLNLLIDTVSQALQMQVAASVGQATVGAIASPESIATAGVAGVAKALALVALIKTAASVAKAAISNSISKDGGGKYFAEGGYTGDGYGAPDSSGHKPAGIVHAGEYVLPKWMVNSNPSLVASLEQQRLRGYATGGYVQPPSTRQWLGGQHTALNLDYNQLAQAMSRFKVQAAIQDIRSADSKHTAKMNIVNP